LHRLLSLMWHIDNCLPSPHCVQPKQQHWNVPVLRQSSRKTAVGTASVDEPNEAGNCVCGACTTFKHCCSCAISCCVCYDPLWGLQRPTGRILCHQQQSLWHERNGEGWLVTAVLAWRNAYAWHSIRAPAFTEYYSRQGKNLTGQALAGPSSFSE